METVLVLIGFVLLAVFFFFTGWIHILFCAVNYFVMGWHDTEICISARWALLMYGVVLGIPLVIVLSIFKEDYLRWLDNFIGFFFQGRHRMKRHVIQNRRIAHREFVALMRRQQFDDARAAQLFPEMSWLRQRIWSVRYKKRAEEASRLREITAAQTEAIRRDSRLAHALAEREIEREARQ